MTDYIKREDAIKAVKHLSRNYTGRGKREDHPHIDFIIDEIKYEVSSADVTQKWILCKERLLESIQEVLVTGINGCVYTSRIVHGEFEYGGNVIAWMPLPEPYEERKDND